MSDTIIRAEFEGRLKAWAAAQAPPLQVAYENVEFDPPAAPAVYLRCYLLPAMTESLTLAGNHRQYRGVWQVSIVVARGVGNGPAEKLVPALDALYPVAQPATRSGLRILVMKPMSAARPIVEDDSQVIPVSLRYQVDTA